MHLISGPAGSGKSTLVLGRLREALARQDTGARLLAPTATLARHLQNRLAREGLVFSPNAIQTMSRFLDEYAAGIPQVSSPVLYLIVEEAVRTVNRPEFARVAGLPGFSASLARTIEEFSSAGCDSARLSLHLPDTPLGEAFLAVYREVDRELARRGFRTRAARLEAAAQCIAAEGLEGVHTLWLDGFQAFPDPELNIVNALARRADVTVTLTDGDATAETRSRLLAMGASEERLPRRRPTPATVMVKAPNLEREGDEIARRILEQHRAGRPFREIGIIVRSAERYVPLLRSTLERFGIPARFYFDTPLVDQPAVRFLSGAVEAMLGGWDHEAVLRVLRLAPRFAGSSAMDRFDFAVREQIPNRGLGSLKALLPESGERIARLIDRLGGLEEWRSFVLDPADWAARFRTLRNLFRPARPEDADAGVALLWRSQAAALDLFDQALDHAAAALGGRRHIPLEAFWRAVEAVLRLEPLRFADDRRNVVHVLSAHEARQWELPVVFVCGLVERQFPGFQRQDPFFPDEARCLLRRAGIRVRTARDFEIEERALFDSALTRATMYCVLSYPEFDARGDRNLPSIYLEDRLLPRSDWRLVRPRPRSTPPATVAPAIRDPRLLEQVRSRSEVLSPSALEQYLQCPFQYFGSRTLRLKPPPCRPADRLDFMLQGNIVHQVLHEWWARPQPVEPLFDRIFNEICEENGVPAGYRRERLHDSMLADVVAFTRDERWKRDGRVSRTEEEFCFALDEALQIRGRIDRLDIEPDGRAWVIDYKYSGRQATRDKLDNDDLLQAPLYYLAAERFFGLQPAGMFYIGLRGKVEYAGWASGGTAPVPANPLPDGWTVRARTRTLAAVEEIRGGRIAPEPSNLDRCRWCDFADVCRVETAAFRADSRQGTEPLRSEVEGA